MIRPRLMPTGRPARFRPCRRPYPVHLERLSIHRPGLRSLPILPPKHVWMVSGMRDLPWPWRISRAQVYMRDRVRAASPASG